MSMSAKYYQRLVIFEIILLFLIFLYCTLGMRTTKSVYLWNKTATEQLAEVNRYSVVIKLGETGKLTHVFYLKECKVGYIKSQYLDNIVKFDRQVEIFACFSLFMG